MTRSEISILGSTFAGHILCHASVLVCVGLLVPLKNEFHLTEFWVTTLPLLGYICMGLGAVPAGMAADRWGARPVLLGFFLFTGIFCAAAAMASDVWSLVVALTLLGATASLYHPTGLAFISHGIAKRGHALGIHGVAGSIGLGGSAIGLWMAGVASWRAAYWVIAVLAILCAVVFWLLPIEVRYAAEAKPETNKSTGTGRSIVVKILVLLFAATMLSGFNYRALMTTIPTYLTATSSGVYLGVGSSLAVFSVFLAAGLGQYFSGRFADRADPAYLYVGLVATSIPLALLLAWSAGVGNTAYVIAMGLALVHFGTQPAENLLIARLTPPHIRSTAYGIKAFMTFGVGALGAPAVGFLWRRTGTLAWTFVMVSVVAVFTTIVVLMLAKSVRIQDRARAASP